MSAGAKVTAQYPTQVWDRTTPTRPDVTTYKEPTADDWNQAVAEIVAMQKAQISGDVPTFAATMTAVTANSVHDITVAGGTSATCTINADLVGALGIVQTFLFRTSDTTSVTVTFGTNFRSTGTLATGVTSGKLFVVTFISDGTKWVERSRTAVEA